MQGILPAGRGVALKHGPVGHVLREPSRDDVAASPALDAAACLSLPPANGASARLQAREERAP